MTPAAEHLPVGCLVTPDGRRVAAARWGDSALDLARLDPELFGDGTLDRFLAAGPETWERIGEQAAAAVRADSQPLLPLAGTRPRLGFTVADYVDFYTSAHHAANAGAIVRPDSPALPRSWGHLPIGYHGRSGTVQITGTPVVRPVGVLGPDEVGPTRRLDFEAEVAFLVGVPGTRIDPAEADRHVFGVCLLNDWSARDIQAFEMAPLGPFLGKSFATSVAGWITPLTALRDARIAPAADTPPPTHLRDDSHGLDLELEVRINGTVVSRPPFATMAWSYAQLLAHLTSNGAPVRTGDLFASGTVSGPRRDQRGCLLELTWGGRDPLALPGGERRWLADGDEVRVGATAGEVVLAEVTGRVEPSRPAAGSDTETEP